MIGGQLQEIKDRLDIAEVLSGYMKLTKAGRNFKALCPFHNEKTPSFIISPDRQIWHCFGCGEGGDIFTFVMKIEGMDFSEALRVLADRAGVRLEKIRYSPDSGKKPKILDICEAAKNFYKEKLNKTEEGLAAKKYLLGRGLTEESIGNFEMGYSPNDWHATEIFLRQKGFKESDIFSAGFAVKNENNKNFYDRFRGRIMFPISDISNHAVGFGGRTFANKESDEAKYINTPESEAYSKSRLLYGLNFAREHMRKNDECVLVEGYMDVIGSHQTGVKNAVSSSGTALTGEQIKIIKRYASNLILAFDGDEAGQEATRRSIDLAVGAGLSVRIIVLPAEKDPSDFVDNPEEWKQRAKEAKRVMDFHLERAFGSNDSKSVEGRKAISGGLLAEIKKIPNSVEQAHWIGVLAEKLDIEEKFLAEELRRIKTLGRAKPENFGNEKPALISKISQEEEWEGRLLALVAILPGIEKRMEKMADFDFNFKNEDFGRIFKVIADLRKEKSQDLPAGRQEKDLPAEIKKSISLELFQKLSELMLEVEYLSETEGSKDAPDDGAGSLQEKNFQGLLTRLMLKRYEDKKRGLEQDLKLAEKNKDYESRKLLIREFEEMARKMERLKKA